MTRLSTRDTSILNLLFDPEAQQTVAAADDPENDDQPILGPTSSATQLEDARLVEQRAVLLAEEGSLQEAEDLLSWAIKDYPTEQPSLWSNRAQVRRLSGNVSGALSDLSQAIRIATPPKHTAPTIENAKVLSCAYTHRATIHMLAGRGEISGALETDSPERLEEYASHDFAMAGRYGSDLARAMAVRTNPYAKMCGSIVQTAMKNEMQPFIG
jgi:tetratricopeptide (TPR) repeat protein